MKKNLGKIIILISIFLNLNADEYSWSASINKQKAYVNEAVHLHYSCKFKARDELHVIEFNPVGKYKDYDIYLLSESENIVDGKRVNDFEFVAFLKSSGLIEFNFDVLMKKTNQDSIENTVLGRDNADYEQFSKKLIKQKTLSLEVLKNDIELVGEFEFKIKKDDTDINSYEPYHVELIIDGVGNLDKLKKLDLKIAGAKVFSSDVKKNYTLSEDGYKGTWSQKFAIISEKNFEFPNINYVYFDKKSNKVKKYEIETFKVDVKELYKKEELLDEVEESKPIFKIEYLYYVLIFIAGFLVGKIKIKKENIDKKDDTFSKKINECKTLDELLVLLIVNNSSQFSDVIKKIETNNITLSQAKKLLN